MAEHKKFLSLFIKRSIDFIGGALLLILLAPLFIGIAVAIRVDSKGPVFFKQQRVGLNGVSFNIYKFRSMVDNAVNIGLGLDIEQNDSRITRVGKLLRDWSLDELPQIINIAKGDMSFIGPRPTLQYQVDGYTPHQRKRLDMKPGITGWAQVNGRNNIPWEERIELDVWYVENWSFWLDIKILFKTFGVVVKKDAVYNADGVSYDFNSEAKKDHKEK